MGGPVKFPAGYYEQACQAAAQGHRVTLRRGDTELVIEPSTAAVHDAPRESEADTCAGKFGRAR